MDIDERHFEREAADSAFGSHRDAAIAQTHIGGGAAHIKRDDFLVTCGFCDVIRADDTSGRTGEHRADARCMEIARRNAAAVGEHQTEGFREPLRFGKRGEVPFQSGPDISVRDGGAETLIFSVFRQELVGTRNRDVERGEVFGSDLLVLRIHVSEEETDGDGIKF